MKNVVAVMAGMFFLIVWPGGGLWTIILRPVIGGGTEQSFLYPIYAGIILLAGILAGCTVCIIEEIRSLPKQEKKSAEEIK